MCKAILGSVCSDFKGFGIKSSFFLPRRIEIQLSPYLRGGKTPLVSGFFAETGFNL
jgi:hypothetical protein